MTSKPDDHEGSGSHSRRRHKHEPAANLPKPPPAAIDASHWLGQHPMAVGMVVALIVAMLGEMPWIGRPVRVHIEQFLVVGFFVWVAAFGSARENLLRAVTRGPAPLLLCVLVWCGIEVVNPPSGHFGLSKVMQPYANAEMLRMLYCGGVFFTAAYLLRARDLQPIVIGTLSIGMAVAVFGFIKYSSSGIDEMTSIFGNHEQAGSFLTLLLPVAVAFALDQTTDRKLQIGGQVATALIGAALLLARTRSAWIGAAIGIVTLFLIWGRYGSTRITQTNKFKIVGPAMILIIAFGMLVFSSELSPMISSRASTFVALQDDTSLRERLHRWDGACRMAYERPLTGWGLGSFPILQRYWTGTGAPAPYVLIHGIGHSNLAHNFWVQWAAETGATGVVLYAATMVCFLLCAYAALQKRRDGFRKTLLMGCIAALACACGDMMGAPSYTYTGVSSLPWLWMGIGIACCRDEKADRASSGDVQSLPATPIKYWLISLAAGAVVACVIIGVGSRQPRANLNEDNAPLAPTVSNPASAESSAQPL